MSLSVLILLSVTVSAPADGGGRLDGLVDTQTGPVVISPMHNRHVKVAQVQIEQRTIIRVRPIPAPQAATPQQRVRWDEKKGPKCLNMAALAGALVSSPTSIDLMMRGGLRMRAKLERTCPSIDFYSGFYVRPTKDGRICSDRDVIHARTGGQCGVESFKTLVPAK